MRCLEIACTVIPSQWHSWEDGKGLYNLLARIGQAQCVGLCILESLCHVTVEFALRCVCQASWASCVGITRLRLGNSPT